MADARSTSPTGPFLLRAKGKEVRFPTLAAVRRVIANEFANSDVVVIDLASGRRIIFKEAGTAGGGDVGTISAPAGSRPGFFLSAATELEVVSADKIVIDPPAPSAPPTPRPAGKPTRTRSTDHARPLSPLPPRPQAPPKKRNSALLWISAPGAGLLVLIVLGLVISGGRHKPGPPTAPGPAPTPANAPIAHAAQPSEAPRGAEPPSAARAKPTPAQAEESVHPPLGGPGLVAFYRFDDALHLGKDSSGNHHDAISSDGATIGFDPTLKREVLILLGHSEIRLPRTISRDFSISLWLNTSAPGISLPDTPGQPWFFGLGLVDADVPGPRADFGSSVLNGRFAFGIGDPDTTLRSTSAIADGRWHFLTVTRANSGRVQLYVDALQETTGDCPSGERNAPATMVIGRLMSGSNFLVARLSNLRFYDRQLTDLEILDLLHGEGAAP